MAAAFKSLASKAELTGGVFKDPRFAARSDDEESEEMARGEPTGAFAENVVDTATVATIATTRHRTAKRPRLFVNNSFRAIEGELVRGAFFMGNISFSDIGRN
jgi:hypothetical protein